MDQIPAKNIIICCDGTGNQYGENNTNVVKLFEMLASGEDQKIYYDPGVGTASKALLRPFQVLSTALSQALGLDLQKNVEDAYYYLMNTYHEGDRIFLFGFSRGAHTVRRLASMLEKVELLHRGSENMIPYASRMYLDKKIPEGIVEGFRSTYSRNCPVHLIGVWDTVASVSRLLPRPKLDGIFSSEVRFAYHAVSIDEKRFNFPPNLWKKDTIADWQTVEEVWFAGVHADVGGGYAEQGLSNIALKWILEKSVPAGLKLKKVDIEAIPTNPLAPKHESWKGIWWFIPFHMYIGLAVLAALLSELVLRFGYGVWGEVSWHPAQWLLSALQAHWLIATVFLLALIPLNQKRRRVPKDATLYSNLK